jgi:hypothetical protein
MATKKGLFGQISGNVKRNFDKKNMRSLAYAAIGGALYPLIPTIIQGFSGKVATGANRVDMSGWKGVLTGGITTALVGMASNKMEIAYGGFAAMITHITYVKANDTIASFTGSPIFAFDKSSQIQNVLSDNLPNGMEYITLPDGKQVLASSGVSDYVPALVDYRAGVSDYVPALGDYRADLSDYVDNFRGDTTVGMSDFFDDVSNGVFN